MGNLTRTVSGGVVNFKSAARASIESLKCYFEPVQEGSGDPSPTNVRPISGWTNTNIHITGKNMIPFIIGQLMHVNTYDGQIFCNYNNGSISLKNGNGNGGFLIHLHKDETVTFSFLLNYVPQSAFIRQRIFRKETLGSTRVHNAVISSNSPSTTYTADLEADYIFTFYAQDYESEAPNGELIISNWQVEHGSVTTAYEPYKGSIIPVDWTDNGTIYGGYVDLVSGELVATWEGLTYTGAADEDWHVSANGHNFYIATPSNFARLTNPDTMLCNRAKSTPDAVSLSAGGCKITNTGNFNIDIGASIGISSVSAFKIWLASNPVQVICRLTSNVTHQLTPQQIKTMLGTNNIWSDANGQTEVTYAIHDAAPIRAAKQRITANEPHLETASGDIATFNASLAAPLKSLRVDLEPIQLGSGDPSPTNVRPISGMTGVDVNIINDSGNIATIPVSWESQAGTVYGGYVDLVSGELVVNRGFVTLDGNAIMFSGMYTDATRYRAYTPSNSIPGLLYGANKDAKPIASNMLGKPNSTTSNLEYTPPFITAGGYNAQFYVALPLSLGFSSVADANAWLSENPIQVSYLLMNEQRYQLSPQQIKVLRGNNCIFVNDKNAMVKYWTVKTNIKTIGGLPVLIDNARFQGGARALNDYIADDAWFITGWYDTGTTGSKSYRMSASLSPEWSYTRWFNDIGNLPVDYWGFNKNSERTVSAPGRFIAVGIYKQAAADVYLYDNTNGQYIFKGSNVT